CVAALATRGGVAHAGGAHVGKRAMWLVPPAIAVVTVGAWAIARDRGASDPAASAPSIASGSAASASHRELVLRKLGRDARSAARSRIAAAHPVGDADPATRASGASGAASVSAPAGRVKVYDFSGGVLGEAPPLPPPSANPSDKTT